MRTLRKLLYTGRRRAGHRRPIAHPAASFKPHGWNAATTRLPLYEKRER